MKRILFILSMLIGVAYGQTTGYFRYDTIAFQKNGGNAEFNLYNGTRNVTGGVLTNMGGGRTRFVLPTGGTNVSIGSGYKVAVNGTNNVKSIGQGHLMTLDSATSGQVGISFGGRATVNINGSMANNTFKFDSLGNGTRFVQYPVSGGRSLSMVNTDGTDSAAFYLQGRTIGTKRQARMMVNDGSVRRAEMFVLGSPSLLAEIQVTGTNQGGLLLMDSTWSYIQHQDFNTAHAGFMYAYSDSILIEMTSNIADATAYNSALKLYQRAQDQYAHDRLAWRTTDSTGKIVIEKNYVELSTAGDNVIELENPTGIIIEPYKQNLYIDSLQHKLTATAKMVTWDSATGRIETRAIPTGGGSQGLQDVITQDNVLTTNNTIDIGSGNQLIFNSSGAGAFIINSETSEKFSASSSNTILTGGTILSNLSMISDSVSLNPSLGKLNIDTLRSGYIDTTLFKPLARKASGDIVQMNSWAQVSGGGSSGITVGSTTITSGTSGRIPYNNSGVYGEDAGLSYNASINNLMVSGPVTNLTQMPKVSIVFDSDANAVQSAFAYDHDNTAWMFDAWYNGSNFISSAAGSNFAWYKTANELRLAYNTGTSAGSSFSFSYGAVFDVNGRVGIGVSPTSQLHTTGTVRFANFGAGTATFDGSGNVSSSSDKRKKENIRPFKSGLDVIRKINPNYFTWNKMSGLNMNDKNVGFIAQDILPLIPEAVGKDSQGYLSLNDRPILAANVNATKELYEMVIALQKEVSILKALLKK